MTISDDGWDLNCLRCNKYFKNYCTKHLRKTLKEDTCDAFTAVNPKNKNIEPECRNCVYFSNKYCEAYKISLNNLDWCNFAELR